MRSSGGGVIPVTQSSSFGRGRGWRNGSVLGWEGLGDRVEPRSLQCVWGLEGEAWNPGTPPSWDLLSTPPLRSAGVSSHQALPHPHHCLFLFLLLWSPLKACSTPFSLNDISLTRPGFSSPNVHVFICYVDGKTMQQDLLSQNAVWVINTWFNTPL